MQELSEVERETLEQQTDVADITQEVEDHRERAHELEEAVGHLRAAREGLRSEGLDSALKDADDARRATETRLEELREQRDEMLRRNDEMADRCREAAGRKRQALEKMPLLLRAGRSARWQTYANPALGFRLDYPSGWTAEAPGRDGPSVVVRFLSPDARCVILVDVDTPTLGRPPQARWQHFDARFARAYGDRYHRLGIEAATLGGSPAARWTFTLQRKGRPDLEKVDTGTTRAGTDYALLGEAPVTEFPEWRAAFDHVAASFVWER